jgi:hypothetical protein
MMVISRSEISYTIKTCYRDLYLVLIYEGGDSFTLQVIPITDSGNLVDAFNIRLDELKVLNLGFLYNSINPTLAVLYEDTKEQRHIKTYEVRVRSKVSMILDLFFNLSC